MAKAPKTPDMSFLERLPVSEESLHQLLKLRDVVASTSEHRRSAARDMADTVEWVFVEPEERAA